MHSAAPGCSLSTQLRVGSPIPGGTQRSWVVVDFEKTRREWQSGLWRSVEEERKARNTPPKA